MVPLVGKPDATDSSFTTVLSAKDLLTSYDIRVDVGNSKQPESDSCGLPCNRFAILRRGVSEVR
jgi:hypothetical protein